MSVTENTIGVNFDEVVTPGIGRERRFKTGTQVRGEGGALYQYAVATTAIAASTATVNITESGGVYSAAATGGSATSPATAMAIGDYAWFAL